MMARAHSPQFYCSFSQPCLAFVSRRSIEQHYFYLSLSLFLFLFFSLSFSLCLARLLASASLPSRIPLTLSLFLSLCLSPRPLSSYTSLLLFHRSPPSLFLPLFFSPPGMIQGSSSGGRPDANWRKKEREREDRGTVMLRATGFTNCKSENESLGCALSQ